MAVEERPLLAVEHAAGVESQPFAVRVVIGPAHDLSPSLFDFSLQSLKKSWSFSLSICRPRKSLFFTVPRGIRFILAISS